MALLLGLVLVKVAGHRRHVLTVFCRLRLWDIESWGSGLQAADAVAAAGPRYLGVALAVVCGGDRQFSSTGRARTADRELSPSSSQLQ